MKPLPSLFSHVHSRVKLFVFAMIRRRRYSIFVCLIYGLEEKNSKSEVIFAVCRLPSCLSSLISSLPRFIGLRAVAHLWQEFVLEMRYRWENDIFIPR